MSDVAFKIFIVMIVMALLVTLFGISASNNFFVVLGDTVGVISNVTDKAVLAVRWFFEADAFEDDDKIVIERMFFEDGHYADIGYRFTIKGTFAKRVFLYCSNPAVKRMESNRWIAPNMTEGFWKWRFYDMKGDLLYTNPSIFNFVQRRDLTYGEYKESYQKNPSKDGWKW